MIERVRSRSSVRAIAARDVVDEVLVRRAGLLEPALHRARRHRDALRDARQLRAARRQLDDDRLADLRDAAGGEAARTRARAGPRAADRRGPRGSGARADRGARAAVAARSRSSHSADAFGAEPHRRAEQRLVRGDRIARGVRERDLAQRHRARRPRGTSRGTPVPSITSIGNRIATTSGRCEIA